MVRVAVARTWERGSSPSPCSYFSQHWGYTLLKMYKPKKIIREPKTRPTARQPLEKALHHLQDKMLALGSRVSRNIVDSVEMMQTQNVEQAAMLIIADRDINQARYQIEAECLQIIAAQNPLARDLRTITTGCLYVTGKLVELDDEVPISSSP